MESENKHWWQRLTDTIMKSRRTDGRSKLPAVDEDGLLAEPAEPRADTEIEPAAEKLPGTLTRWSKRDQTLAQLQEGYERVNQLIADIQKHMASQSERTERMCNALEQLSRSMADLPDIAQQQARTLESIVGQMETANTRSQQLTSAVGELPKAARAQTETLAGINRQLEMAGEQSVVASQAMEKLGTAIRSVGDISSAQTGILTHLINSKTDEQNQRIDQLAASQNKRFVILFVVAAVLAVAAIAAVVASITLRP